MSEALSLAMMAEVKAKDEEVPCLGWEELNHTRRAWCLFQVTTVVGGGNESVRVNVAIADANNDNNERQRDNKCERRRCPRHRGAAGNGQDS